MKFFIFAMSLILSSPAAFACSEPSRTKVGSIIHNLKSPTYWRTVRGTSFQGNTSFPALVTVQRQIDKSFVEYKGDIYRFDQQGIVLCDRARSNEIQVVHPSAKATVIRTGNGNEALLTVRAGFITMRLRPAHLVSASRYEEDSEDFDLFQMLFKPVY